MFYFFRFLEKFSDFSVYKYIWSRLLITYLKQRLVLHFYLFIHLLVFFFFNFNKYFNIKSINFLWHHWFYLVLHSDLFNIFIFLFSFLMDFQTSLSLIFVSFYLCISYTISLIWVSYSARSFGMAKASRHAIHSSNIFQHISSACANCQVQCPVWEPVTSHQSQKNLICASRGNAKLSPSAELHVSASVSVCLSLSLPLALTVRCRREKCST